ncbi:hypothetical protein [[Haemophilus] ducreyi]|uniref:hypothetical protein n=1 Tax=Haemophilus ducreyi TaxID=730 RepID=UPI001E3EFF6C|nr:hypothetical protein [[Haemophilus] ducreyi]
MSWAYRDRDVQADKLIPHSDDSTLLGDGVSYEITLLDGGNVVRKITTREAQFSYPDAAKIDGEQFDKISLYSVKNGLRSLWGYQFALAGVMQLLSAWDYNRAFSKGNNFVNHYDDNDMPGGKYVMLSSYAKSDSEIYHAFTLTAGQYKRFALSYKVGSYNQRKGLCTVAVQLYVGDRLVKELLSQQFGNYDKSEWHPQQVTDDLPADVTEIRFRVNPIGELRNNAIAFTDIILRAGGD